MLNLSVWDRAVLPSHGWFFECRVFCYNNITDGEFVSSPWWGMSFRKTNEQGYGGSRVLGGISLWFWYIYIGSQDQLIVQNVLLSKCAELLTYVGCLLLSLRCWPWKGRVSQSQAPLRFRERWKGEQTWPSIKVSGLTSHAWPLRLILVRIMSMRAPGVHVQSLRGSGAGRPSPVLFGMRGQHWTNGSGREHGAATEAWNKQKDGFPTEAPHSHFTPTWPWPKHWVGRNTCRLQCYIERPGSFATVLLPWNRRCWGSKEPLICSKHPSPGAPGNVLSDTVSKT